MSTKDDQLTPNWVSTENSVPPMTDWMTERSDKVLVASPELADGIGFGYYYHDEEDPCWTTSCRDRIRLEQVTHYAIRPSLPEGLILPTKQDA